MVKQNTHNVWIRVRFPAILYKYINQSGEIGNHGTLKMFCLKLKGSSPLIDII